jgi:hypothetical protein
VNAAILPVNAPIQQLNGAMLPVNATGPPVIATILAANAPVRPMHAAIHPNIVAHAHAKPMNQGTVATGICIEAAYFRGIPAFAGRCAVFKAAGSGRRI